MILALQIASLLFLTLASAFFSCTEVAFFSLPAAKVKAFRYQLDAKKRRIARLIARSKSLLVTIFMYNTIVNVLIQNTSSDLFVGGWVYKVVVPLLIVLILGELIPKYIGLVYNQRLALAFVTLVERCEWLITPLRLIITKLASFLSRLFFFFLKAEPPLSKDELAHILQTSEGKGLLHREEAELIYGLLYLEEKQTGELMRSRREMPIYDIEEPISKLIHLFNEENKSEKIAEVALFEMPEEKMLGIITARDFFIHRNEIHTGKDTLKAMKRPFFVPETTTARSLLEQLQVHEGQTAWVIDEYGAPSGFITEQDLLRYILGQTAAPTAEEGGFEWAAKDAIIASGQLTLDSLNDLFDVKLESEYRLVTVGGYLCEKLQSVAPAGATWEATSEATLEEGSLFFRVLASDPTKIQKVYIQKRAGA